MPDPRIDLARLAKDASGDMVLCMLDSVEVVVEAESERASAHADQVAIYNLVNQVSRLFAHVTVNVGGEGANLLTTVPGDTFNEALTVLRADLALTPAPSAFPIEQLHLSWGGEPAGEGLAGDCDGWTYSVAPRHRPLSRETDAPPLGALAASSFLAAKALAKTLAPLGVPYFAGDGFTANLLDYALGPAPDAPVGGAVGEVVLCGCGSVGTSFAYCAILGQIEADNLHLVDDDGFKERNTFRYPVLRGVTQDGKVYWLTRLLADAGIRSEPYEGSVQKYLDEFDDPPTIKLAAVSVDTVDGRRDATDLLAKTTLNAGVLGLRLHVARHAFGEEGCAYCQYVNVDPPLSEAALLHEQTGLPVERIVELEVVHGTLEQRDVDEIIASGRLASSLPEVGDRLSDLRRRVYAQSTVSTAEGDVLVSAPFVSALAGLLLLAEAVKEGTPELHPWRLDGRVDFDLSGDPSGLTSTTIRDSSGRCLCHSPHRRRFYGELHGFSEADGEHEAPP